MYRLIDRYSKKVTLSPLIIMDRRCKAKNEFMNQVQCKRNLIIFDHIVGKTYPEWSMKVNFFIFICSLWTLSNLIAIHFHMIWCKSKLWKTTYKTTSHHRNLQCYLILLDHYNFTDVNRNFICLENWKFLFKFSFILNYH